ncbi:MAG: acetolactate synthase small subunit [Armatimonadetes bacterium]|nr:acetolactate synthase small subunit [Armatimonadota bacterium]
MISLNGAPPQLKRRLHTISVLVENRPGVLTRVAGLFARRGYNIDSLAVSTTANRGISRMTIVVGAEDDGVLTQICKQVGKLIDVISVNDHTDEAVVARELALIKVNCDHETRAELMQIIDVFRARTVDIAEGELILEVTGNRDKIDAMLKLMEKYGIREMARTGEIILARGLQPT